MAGSVIARLAVTLGLDTTAFSTNARKVRGEAKGLEKGLGGIGSAGKLAVAGLAGLGVGVVLGGLSSAVSGAFDLASNMSEAATRVGLTVEQLQELRKAGGDAGLSNDQLESSLARLNVKLGDLQAGGKTATDAFAALGLSAADLKGQDAQGALGMIAERLSKIEDPAQRAAIAQAIFGKSYSAMLPMLEGGKKALDEAAKASREQGQLTDEQTKKLDALAESWEHLKSRVSVLTGQLIVAGIDAVEAIGSVTAAINGQFQEWGASVRSTFDGAASAVGRAVTAIKTWLQDKLGAVIAYVGDKLAWLRDRFNALTGGDDGPAGKIKAGFMSVALDTEGLADRAEIATVRIAKSFKDMADQTLSAFGNLSSAIKGGGFLSILESVIGLGLQLGSVGLFGSSIATRINAPAGSTGTGNPAPPVLSGGGMTLASAGSRLSIGNASAQDTGRLQIVPSPYFDVVVDGRVARAAPGIAIAGAQGAVARMAYQQSRRVA